MKILIVSDIHGDFNSLKKVTNEVCYDKLIILGDVFSYGYNNENKNKIIDLLNENKNRLILIKGNCDIFSHQELLLPKSFETLTLHINNYIVTLTHGDKYNKDFLPNYVGDILFNGHTHIPNLIRQNNIICANPGSLGKPRGGSSKSYIIFDDDKITIKSIDNNIIKEMNLS